jgi:tetratricopeptide (TPR) repeat protein
MLFSEAIIEYGGISFECEEDFCAIPDEDPIARKIVDIYDVAIRDANFETGFLRDNTRKWQFFAPFHNETFNCSPYVEVRRFNWEDNGVVNISGEYDTYDDLLLPDDKYFVQQNYPINQSGFIQAFDRMRVDLEFYADLRMQFLQRQIDACNRRIVSYQGYLASGYTHISIIDERATDPVRQSDFSEEEWEEGVYSELESEIRLQEKWITEFVDKRNCASKWLKTSLKLLDYSYEEIDPLLKTIFLRCLRIHQPEGIAYNGAVESLLVGDLPEAMDYIQQLLVAAQKADFTPELMSKIHLLKGQLQAEFCLYGDAVVSLTEAICRNPESKEAYLERAAAYYELGKFDQAIEDYVMYESSVLADVVDRSEFAKGFVFGAAEGFGEAVCSFIPNTLSSFQGMGHLLWATVRHPIDTPRALVASAFEVFAILRRCLATELATLAIPELNHLINKWDQMDDFVRGQEVGHILGKYGTEMLTPMALRKGSAFVMHVHDLKQADKLATLKSLSDIEKKGGILEGSAQVVQNRKQQLAKIKIEWDKQNKHVQGARNFDPDKSRFTHENAEALLQQFAGKGRKMRGDVGSPGYKEKVNFEVVIGHVANSADEFIETTWGSIEYSKYGAHIVPRLPDRVL